MGLGVPVPELVYSGVHPVGVVRVLRWVTGRTVASIVDDPAAVGRFADDLAGAVGALHRARPPHFTSRLDGSAPVFAEWRGYVEHRLGQIRRRAEATGALDELVLARVARVALRLAEEVSPVVRPTVCHRDLHPDNVLVRADGSIAAILDWDLSEAWDPAGDWFKLEWMMLPVAPGLAAAFEAADRSRHPERPLWTERRRLVAVMESANVVANARREGWIAFGDEARRRLHAALHD